MALWLCLNRGFRRANNLGCCAHRGDGKRFVVHANEKLTAFVELESVVNHSDGDGADRAEGVGDAGKPECD